MYNQGKRDSSLFSIIIRHKPLLNSRDARSYCTSIVLILAINSSETKSRLVNSLSGARSSTEEPRDLQSSRSKRGVSRRVCRKVWREILLIEFVAGAPNGKPLWIASSEILLLASVAADPLIYHVHE